MSAVLEQEGRVAALPFLTAIVEQIGRSDEVRSTTVAPSLEGQHTVAGVLSLLREPESADAADRLAGDRLMLAAFFQNIDLLYEHGYEEADAVAALVMHGVERLPDPS
jgi:hypothetical protein